MKIIHSDWTASFVFDEKMNIIEKLPFKNPKDNQLESNEWLEEELELIKKHNQDKLFYLGFKKEKIPGVTFTQDINKLEKVAKSQELLHKESIRITKKKIKASVQKDLLIIHTSNAIEDISRTSNVLAKRLREWYETYNPEFSKSIEDHEKFAELITKQTRTELLKSIGMTEEESMGADIQKEDVDSMLKLAEELKKLFTLRETQKEYLERMMCQYCPNTKAVAGSQIGAKLLTLAGSLKRLSELPASTIQVLGAEKALFRHIRTGARSPKYGVIFNHPFLQSKERKIWGKVGRALADKIAIAARIDYFKGKYEGDTLLKILEKRFP